MHVSHIAAEAPFSLVEVTPRFHPVTDGVVGSRRAIVETGILTYGFACVRANNVLHVAQDHELHVEVMDAKGRIVFRDSRYDLRGRPLPTSPLENELPF